MNQVWVFFKLIEVVLGIMCMFFHMRGSSYWPERIPHIILYCATFLSFAVLAALGAFRLMLTRSSVLSSQLLLTLSAAIAHYLCGVLIMRTAMLDPHLTAMNSSIEYLEHPHFAHCKQQSIAALITGTMYLMHMFHVFDLLMRMEPGDWRRQATGRMVSVKFEATAGRTAGLFVLSKPVDDLLCRCCKCYFKLAHSQPLRFRLNADVDQVNFVARMWQILEDARIKFFTLHHVESDESFLSTPTITSDSEILPVTSEYGASMEEGDKGLRASSIWRGPSDSSSIWAQIEDRSTFHVASNRSSLSSEATMKPAQMDRKINRRISGWADNDRREKSEILLVEQGSSYSRLRAMSNAELLQKRKYEEQTKEAGEQPQKEPKASTRNANVTDETKIKVEGASKLNYSSDDKNDLKEVSDVSSRTKD
ncbi:uncharacterized protein LOC108088114 [Drosophila ficusphila]|uniref:uncharacterized protein LOC108088114 n=1 Tax=Drosophila ficusphila TaxID=30025 RepID=UPI0007E7067F|nr:uncharacterized protein LOC108088114 [Drosophila ficusphila]